MNSDIKQEAGEFCIEKAQSVYLYAGNGNLSYSWFTINDLPANTWHYTTLVYDGTKATSSERIQLYIDGVLNPNTSNSGVHGTTLGSFTNDASIGHRSHNIGQHQYYKGMVDDIVFYNKALTSTEVLALYNSGSGTTTPDTNGLVAHYNFEQTGSTIRKSDTKSTSQHQIIRTQ